MMRRNKEKNKLFLQWIIVLDCEFTHGVALGVASVARARVCIFIVVKLSYVLIKRFCGKTRQTFILIIIHSERERVLDD